MRAIYTEKTIEKAAELVKEVGKLDRKKVRQVFVENFSDKVMVGGYQKIYDKLIANKPAVAESSPLGNHLNSPSTHEDDKGSNLLGSPKSPRSRNPPVAESSNLQHHHRKEGGH